MSYIFQPERYLLKKYIKKHSRYINGQVLDVGAGKADRYKKYFIYERYLRMDIFENNDIDIVGWAEKIPLKENSIDSIICTQVLGDILEPSKAIAEFYRVLKTGGVVLLTESFFNEIHDEPFDYWRFTNFGIESLFKKNGFEILELDQLGGFFTIKSQMNIRYLINRFNLYSANWKRVVNPFFKIFSKLAFFLDNRDKSINNKKFVLGWCLIARKIK